MPRERDGPASRHDGVPTEPPAAGGDTGAPTEPPAAGGDTGARPLRTRARAAGSRLFARPCVAWNPSGRTADDLDAVDGGAGGDRGRRLAADARGDAARPPAGA